MALMFRSVLQNAGGAAELIVTCDSEFAGKTITCTDGTTTLTAVCPSASPYVVEFDLENDGTWTISGTISGTTHSTSITIETNATLHEIPNGSIVTPVANIQTWLHCANIWDKSYTTISQVLADSTTVTALIASTNAVDYMVRSTSWASSVVANSSAMTKIGANNYCANSLLADSTWCTAICNSTYFENVLTYKNATMTSNNTPSGYACSQSNTHSATQPAWVAFDGSETQVTDYTQSIADGFVGQWIKYQFQNPILLKKAVIQHSNAGGTVFSATCKIQGSNNDSTWTDLGSYTEVSTASGQGFNIPKYTVLFPNNTTKYKYIRILGNTVNSGTINYLSFVEIYYYGRT